MKAFKTIALAALLSSPAWSHPCDAALKEGVVLNANLDSRVFESYEFASYFSALNTQQAKKTISGNGMAVIGGIPFSVGMHDDEFRSKQNALARSLRVSETRVETLSYAWSYANTAAFDAWSACIAQTGGLQVWLSDVSSCGATLNLQWRPTSTALEGTIKKVSISKGAVIDEAGMAQLAKGRQIKAGAPPTQVRIKANADTAVDLTIDVNDVATVITLPPRLRAETKTVLHERCAGPELRTPGSHPNQACIRQLGLGVRSPQTHRIDYEVALTEQQVKEGWRFDPATATIDHGYDPSSDTLSCATTKDATETQFRYSLTASGTSPKVSVVCHTLNEKIQRSMTSWVGAACTQ